VGGNHGQHEALLIRRSAAGRHALRKCLPRMATGRSPGQHQRGRQHRRQLAQPPGVSALGRAAFLRWRAARDVPVHRSGFV
jgi:hypothetical protein